MTTDVAAAADHAARGTAPAAPAVVTAEAAAVDAVTGPAPAPPPLTAGPHAEAGLPGLAPDPAHLLAALLRGVVAAAPATLIRFPDPVYACAYIHDAPDVLSVLEGLTLPSS